MTGEVAGCNVLESSVSIDTLSVLVTATVVLQALIDVLGVGCSRLDTVFGASELVATWQVKPSPVNPSLQVQS